MADGHDKAFADAERLVREAQAAAEEAVRRAGGEVPPNGWASAPGSSASDAGAASGAGASGAPFPDLAGIAALIEAVRGTVPPDLGAQLVDALRGLLVALRAVLDFYIARFEAPPRKDVDVRDIPID